MFRGMPPAMQNRILRPTMRKVGPVLVKAAKREASKRRETGLLAKSMGYRVHTHRNKGGVWVEAKPRKGMGKFVSVHKTKRTSKVRVNRSKTSGQRASKSVYRDPARYGHLIMGHGFTDRAGKFHPGLRAYARIADTQTPLVKQIATTGIRAGVAKEAARAFARARK